MTTVIAIATVVYAYYSYGLWRATTEATALTEAMFKATNRPYVGITTNTINEDKENGNMWMFFHLKNSGNIPASDVIFNLTYHSSEEEKYKGDVEGMPGEAKPIVLFPNDTITIPIRFSGEIYKEMTETRKYMYFTVDIRYKGLLEQEHQTEIFMNYYSEWRLMHRIRGSYK